MKRCLLFLGVLVPLCATPAFADPTTNTLELQKNLNTVIGSWGIVNSNAVSPLFSEAAIWPASTSVQKAIEKAAVKLGRTLLTCTVVYDPDFVIASNAGPLVFTTKVTNCR